MDPYRFSYKWGAVRNLNLEEKLPEIALSRVYNITERKAITSFEVITKTGPVLARKSLFLTEMG